jgi:pyridoxamine 5'-phosphate oxidase
LINGPYALRLECEFAARTGTKHAVAVNTCTTALQICLQFLGARDAEILVAAASFTTDLSACRWSGAKPVLVDIDPETLSFNVAEFERKFAGGPVPRPPHWGGYRLKPDMLEIWYGQRARLHERVRFDLADGAWSKRLLYP